MSPIFEIRAEDVLQQAYQTYLVAYDSFQFWHPRFSQRLVVAYPLREAEIRESASEIADQVKLIEDLVDKKGEALEMLYSAMSSQVGKEVANLLNLASKSPEGRKEFLLALREYEPLSNSEIDVIRDDELDFSSIHQETENLQAMIMGELPEVLK